jgi:hypothetical protein
MSHDWYLAANRIGRRPKRVGPRSAPRLFAAALVTAALLAAGPALATDYYLSPTGSDSASGRDPAHPWKSWRPVANRSVLAPGNRVRLMDGVYPSVETGFLAVDCSQSTGQNGTESNPVTIEAVNERQAFLKGDGSARVLLLHNCSHYTIQSLHIESGDSPDFKRAHGALELSGSESRPVTGLVLRRNILARNNRFANSHLMQIAYTTGTLVEENEFYYFHRHALLLYYSDGAVVRRNYANSRGYPDIPGGHHSEGNRGDESFSCYPCSRGTFENNISEGSAEGFTTNASAPASNNAYFGNVSLDEGEGFRPNSRGDELSRMPQDNRYDHNAAVGVQSIAVHNRSTKNTVVRHMSVFTSSPRAQAYEMDSYTKGHRGDGDYRFAYRDSVAVAAPRGAFGVKIESPAAYGKVDWSIDHVWAYGFQTNFSPPLREGRYTGAAERDPGFGPCRLWCPDGAACKGQASDGGDLGATILYGYENGKLTGSPLWDPATGAFLGAGASVAGLNDAAGSSLFDVSKRLNVNQNGCRFPSGYPSGASPKRENEKRPTPEAGAESPNPP